MHLKTCTELRRQLCKYYFTWRGFWDTLHEQPRGQSVLSSRDLNRNTIWKIVSRQGTWRPDLDPVRRGTF
jgi:hypothetical protein